MEELIHKLNEIMSMVKQEKKDDQIDNLLIFNSFSRKLSYFLCENLDPSKHTFVCCLREKIIII
jgi:hypothetical protein